MQSLVGGCIFQSLQKAGKLQHGKQGSDGDQEDGPQPAPVLRDEEQMKQAEGRQKQRSEVVRIEQANAAEQQTGRRTHAGWPRIQGTRRQ